MTPPIPSRRVSSAARKPIPQASPSVVAPPQGGGEGPQPFQGTQALDAILKKTGRVPTHPLTAKSDAKVAVPEVTPAQAKKAEGLRAKAQDLFKKEKFKEALQVYKQAYQINPTDPNIVLGFAMAKHATGDLLKAHDLYNEFLESNPSELEVRTLRTEVIEGILLRFQEMAPKIPKEQRENFAQTAEILGIELASDQAILFAHHADQQIEQLKGMEKGLAELHGKSKEEKGLAIQNLFGGAMKMMSLAALPVGDAKEQAFISSELNRIVEAVFGVLSRFTDADSDPDAKALKPIFDAYGAVAGNRLDDATAAFEIVRSEGYKKLGNGNEESGKKIFKEKLDKIEKFTAEKNQAELDKIYREGLPTGLLDAYTFLKPLEDARTRKIGLAVLDAWEVEIDSEHASKAKEARVWYNAFSEDSKQNDAAKAARRQLDVTGAARKLITDGKVANLKEALEYIVAHETGDLNTTAKEALAKDSTMISSLIKYSADSGTMDAAAAVNILAQAETMRIFGASKLAVAMYTVVQLRCGDKGIRAQAEEGIKKAS